MTVQQPREIVAAIIVCAAMIFIYPLFVPTPLLEPDEGLHAAIAQEMLEHHEWVVPQFRGTPFLDKPAFYFWVQMISLKWLNHTETAIRLPGLLFGLLGAVTTGILAGHLFDRRTGLLATLMTMSMVIPLSLSQSAAHDVALVPWTNLSLLGFYQLAARSQKASVVAWFLFTAGSIALAMLTKGLIGIAITCVGTGLLLTVNWFLPSLHPNSSGRSGLYRTAFLCAAAVALGLCLASPWFIAVEVRSPGYLYYYFVERHVLGFATATQPHGQEPWYFYLPVLALGAMPWAAFVLPLVISETYRWYHKLRDRSVLFVICWLVGGLLFLSTAHSKLVTYALPLFPAVAILAAVSWRRFETRNIPQVARQLFRKLSFAIGVLGILLPVGTLICLQLLMHIHSPPAAYACSAALALYSALSLAFFHTGQYSRTISIAATWISGFAFLIITWPLQAISQAHSERDLAHWFNHQQHPPECLLMVGEQPYSVLFYLNPDLRECGTANNIQRSDLARLSSPESLRPGTVIAITQREQAIAHRQGVHIPGVLLSVEGQFSLYEIQQPTVSVAELNRKIFQ